MTAAVPEPGVYEWPPLPVTDLELAATIMAERLGAAWDDLEAERVAVVTSLTLGRKREVDQWLTEFQSSIAAFVTRVGGDVEAFLRLHVGPRYQQAVEQVTRAPMSWTTVHTTALTSLAVDTYGDFLQRAHEAEQVTTAFVTAVRAAAGAELPKIAAGGRTAVQVGDRLATRLLRDYGIDHVTYRDGTRMPVRPYARMAARTKSAVAYNAGTLNGCVEVGVGYVEIFDSPDCGFRTHDDPDRANGSVRSLAEAGLHPIAHPNCTRAVGPRPDVTTDEEAAGAESLQPDSQRADAQALADARATVRAPARRQTRARALARARRQVQRQARTSGGPQDVNAVVRQALRDRGLI